MKHFTKIIIAAFALVSVSACSGTGSHDAFSDYDYTPPMIESVYSH
jgi:hypothetical protein